MNFEPDIIRTIAANPDDDNVRLIYADWCDDQGESEYAEFIRVQVALAGMKDVGERAAMWRQNVIVMRCVEVIPSKQLNPSDFGMPKKLYGTPVSVEPTPPTFICEVDDSEIMGIERQIGSGRSIGRISDLLVSQQTVQLQMLQGFADGSMIRIRPQSINTERDYPKHKTMVTVVPELIYANSPKGEWSQRYYTAQTKDITDYLELQDREKSLMTTKNLRSWTDGPWYDDGWDGIDLQKTLNQIQVFKRNPRPGASHYRYRFRLDRGFVVDAALSHADAVKFYTELREQFPLATISLLQESRSGIIGCIEFAVDRRVPIGSWVAPVGDFKVVAVDINRIFADDRRVIGQVIRENLHKETVIVREQEIARRDSDGAIMFRPSGNIRPALFTRLGEQIQRNDERIQQLQQAIQAGIPISEETLREVAGLLPVEIRHESDVTGGSIALEVDIVDVRDETTEEDE